MFERLISHWVYGGALAAVVLLALSPLLLAGWPMARAAAFLLLPAYMLHQYEEHDDDRFRRYFNATLGKGFEVLSTRAVFMANVVGVWVVVPLSIYAAALIDIGWALVAVYLVLVNAAVHIVHGLAFRHYNPGLLTAVLVFVPLGAFTLHAVDRADGGSVAYHAVGLTIAVAIHAAILVHVRRKLAVLQRAQAVARGA